MAFTYKIVVIGEAECGKTHIIAQYKNEELPQNPAATIQPDFRELKNFELNGKVGKVNIWDTAGQQSYRDQTTAMFRNAVGALIVYDITRKPTFEKLEMWTETLFEKAGSRDVQVCIVGNKVDLVEKGIKEREVTREEGEAIAQKGGFAFFETSAITGHNIAEAFERLLDMADKKVQENKAPGPGPTPGPGPPPMTITAKPTPKKSGGCC